jgi:hypothetical protein
MSSEKSEVALETSEAKKRKIDVEEDESKKVYFLPTLSPSLPKTNAPKGRTTNPAANVASVERNAAVGFVFGKNCSDKIVARLPKIKKSYHSISVPTEEAVITDQRFLLSVGETACVTWLKV